MGMCMDMCVVMGVVCASAGVCVVAVVVGAWGCGGEKTCCRGWGGEGLCLMVGTKFGPGWGCGGGKKGCWGQCGGEVVWKMFWQCCGVRWGWWTPEWGFIVKLVWAGWGMCKCKCKGMECYVSASGGIGVNVKANGCDKVSGMG